MHQNRYVKTFLYNEKGEKTNSQILLPDVANNRGILNCGDFCKNRNVKVVKSLDVRDTPGGNIDSVAMIFYSLNDTKNSKHPGEIVIQYDNENQVLLPQGVIFVLHPN